MSRRRVFHVDLPEAEDFREEPAAPSVPARRGPMASAIHENAESLRSRTELEARIRAENDALAHEFVRLRDLGLVVELVPLDRIDAARLVRDRARDRDLELADLVASIREIGLSNPIRLEMHGDRYELVQGWRRLQAYHALFAETGEERWSRIPAGVARAGEDLGTSYRRMVDENLVRQDISFAEMAELARAYAEDPSTLCRDADAAVAELFRSASYQKRSYIRAFVQLLSALDGALRHPRALPRNLGLDLRRRLEGEPDARDALLRLLRAAPPDRDEATELDLLRAFALAPASESSATRGRTPGFPPAERGPDGLRVFVAGAELRVRGGGRTLELRLDGRGRHLDETRLREALAAFMAVIEG